jgi:hypothetical protein
VERKGPPARGLGSKYHPSVLGFRQRECERDDFELQMPREHNGRRLLRKVFVCGVGNASGRQGACASAELDRPYPFNVLLIRHKEVRQDSGSTPNAADAREA